MNPISSKFGWRYQKYQRLVRSLVFRQAPDFVFRSNPPPLANEIPVFTFHAVLPDWFEEQCRFLADNGYRTLSAAEFADAMGSASSPVEKAILLTFDDGLKNVWSVAFPLLQKYGLRATCFLIPGCIPQHVGAVRPTLDDVRNDGADLDDVVALGRGPSALANWAEIRFMYDSGVFDFHSHTMHHSLVFTSHRIFDFVSPGYNTHFFGNLHIPLYRRDDRDVYTRDPLLGMPIYEARPRMQAERRFFDDEALRNRCIEVVRNEGSERFFGHRRWRKTLRDVANERRNSAPLNERYETSAERDRMVYEELRQSKQTIERMVPGSTVDQLCFPWFEAADFAFRAAREAGFRVSFLGDVPGRPTNRPGSDLFRVPRVEDFFLERLPGKGRKSVADVLKRLFGLRNAPRQLRIAK